MVVFLYKCEVCGVAVFSEQDHGRTWYNDCCGTCRVRIYYEKVVIQAIDPVFGISINNVEFVAHLGDKGNGDSDTGANQET